MSSATVHHPAATSTAKSTTRAEAAPASPAPKETYEEQNARQTRQLAIVTGVSIAVLLVFFLAMMWILSGNDPRTALY